MAVIQILSPQLANQIAAGEVVERPASVVKELVENSLDAGASQIDIDIEKGGSKLIRVRDNGFGIAEDDLILALSRHATSKISHLDDLEQICSLGFRGEALASISSVSRLTLTSRPENQSAAWQANAAGRDMQVDVRPAAHPAGTTIEVQDLFFNTPARRKFLRTDKTELGHIDELVKRLALSRYDVSWTLTHNGQALRRLKAATNQQQQLKRVAAICGRQFAEHAAYIENQYDEMRLWGWLLPPVACSGQLACQYSYVNGRMIKDKLFNHAIRQAYGDMLSAEQQPVFVLYLELPARQVDVNVHPAKHEVRFHQARLVHDFVVSALNNALQQLDTAVLIEPAAVSRVVEPVVRDKVPPAYSVAPTYREYHTKHGTISHHQPSSAHKEQVAVQLNYLQQQSRHITDSLPEMVMPLIAENRYALYQQQHKIVVVDLVATLAAGWVQQPQSTAALLLPVRLGLQQHEKQYLCNWAAQIEQLGFDILLQDDTAIVRAVPVWLRHTALSQWLPEWFGSFQAILPEDIASVALSMLLTANRLAVTELLECFRDWLADELHWIAVPLLLQQTLAQFTGETL